MIEFTHTNTRFSVLPQNAQAYRAALDKPAKHKPVALSSKNLTRSYPVYTPGMGTDDYVRAFQRQFDGIQHPITHTCPNYHKPATMLDPSIPEVLEEADPDYVEPIKAVKPKAKAKQKSDGYIQALRAIALLTHDGTPDSVRIAFEHAQRIALGAFQGGEA